MDPEKKSLNSIFPTKYVIPKSLKFSHWPSKYNPLYQTTNQGFVHCLADRGDHKDSAKAHGSGENAHSADRHSVEDGDQRRPDDCGKLGGFQFALYVEDTYNTFVCIYILCI